MEIIKKFNFQRSLNNKTIIVTGGAGFIGSCVIRKLLNETNSTIYNLDKLGYSSDLSSIERIVNSKNDYLDRYSFIKVDLSNQEKTFKVVNELNPDLVIHLAAESHVDRSIDNPNPFIYSNFIGTFNLLEAVRIHFKNLNCDRQEQFLFHHISTDEVFGSLGLKGQFNEQTNYDPRSPYSASKASSDHLVNAWFHTYEIPTLITNCSNNFGPWQFPEKLIPLVINKIIINEKIPLYGNGLNIRDWLYVEDHVDAILLAIKYSDPGEKFCIGGFGERTNKVVVEKICDIFDEYKTDRDSSRNLINLVRDRPGLDFRYSIDSSLIQEKLNWKPKYTFEEALNITVRWYLNNQDWCKKVCESASYFYSRIGIKNIEELT